MAVLKLTIQKSKLQVKSERKVTILSTYKHISDNFKQCHLILTAR